MDIASTSMSGLAATAVADTRQVLVLKKAFESQQQLALGLIESLPPSPSRTHLPEHLGHHINTVA